jgi:hypothetical protein
MHRTGTRFEKMVKYNTRCFSLRVLVLRIHGMNYGEKNVDKSGAILFILLCYAGPGFPVGDDALLYYHYHYH